ncbi:hypothetical protein DFJ73DRAFT_757890 [Zopfochytrium polystomum]|nr:hypothetical protein DFJ73DRAFT_757890 [Zopfochytrium polystomum]
MSGLHTQAQTMGVDKPDRPLRLFSVPVTPVVKEFYSQHGNVKQPVNNTAHNEHEFFTNVYEQFHSRLGPIPIRHDNESYTSAEATVNNIPVLFAFENTDAKQVYCLPGGLAPHVLRNDLPLRCESGRLFILKHGLLPNLKSFNKFQKEIPGTAANVQNNIVSHLHAIPDPDYVGLELYWSQWATSISALPEDMREAAIHSLPLQHLLELLHIRFRMSVATTRLSELDRGRTVVGNMLRSHLGQIDQLISAARDNLARLEFFKSLIESQENILAGVFNLGVPVENPIAQSFLEQIVDQADVDHAE